MNVGLTGSRQSRAEIKIDLAFPAKKGAAPLKREGDVYLTGSKSAIFCVERASPLTTARFRTVGGLIGKWLSQHDFRQAFIDPTSLSKSLTDEQLAAFAEGLVLGTFRFDKHLGSGSPSGKKTVSRISIFSRRTSAALKREIADAVAVAEAVNLAREWGHEPPNIINPVSLAARCRKLAKSCGLGCTVLTDAQLLKMKANGIVQVGIGSKTKSRLIILEYRGRTSARSSRPIALVGKAITFDTGGYSLKDKNGIVGMKYDKCGAMAVIGAMRAVAAIKPARRVIGVIAAAENMISGEAYRPNDIITMLNGKTVEIISTDAEGRMVLADALTYTERKYKPAAMIDLATLTGGVIIALGTVRAGLMTPDEDLAQRLLSSGDSVHERLWRLPLDKEYGDLIKGDDSDLRNSGGRSAHAIMGGMFLKNFVTDATPWAHLDIAGVGDTDKDTPICPKGATGFGVRLLVDFIRQSTARRKS